MAKSRIQTVIALLVLGIGLIVAIVVGVFAYHALTATPIHPSATEIAAVSHRPPPQKWSAAVEQARLALRDIVLEKNLPGLSVAVAIDNDIVWAEGFGWADIENKVPVGPQTKFKIGTLSPLVTSVGLGLILEKGRLHLDDVIQMHVPQYPERRWPVTLRQVAGHTAGIRSDGGDEGPFRSTHCDRTIDGLKLIADKDLLFEPDSDVRFSNYGYILVSAAIEAAANRPFFDFMRAEVFEPLGMTDTMPDSAKESIPDRAMTYFPQMGDPRYGTDGGPRTTDYSCYAGGAAFISTPSDLVRMATALRAGRLLEPATVEQMLTPRQLRSGKDARFGLGWERFNTTLNGTPTTAFGGSGAWMGGQVSALLSFPEHQLVVAVVSNTAYSGAWDSTLKVAELFAAAGRK